MIGAPETTPSDFTRGWTLAGSKVGGLVVRSGPREDFSLESRTTFISGGAVLKGVFEFSGQTEINCELEGELVVNGDLVIGPEAEIRANIFADRILIHGTVYGDIKAEQLIEASPTAVIQGNILSPKLNFKEGSHFRGRCWMNEEEVRTGDQKAGDRARGN